MYHPSPLRNFSWATKGADRQAFDASLRRNWRLSHLTIHHPPQRGGSSGIAGALPSIRPVATLKFDVSQMPLVSSGFPEQTEGSGQISRAFPTPRRH